jgi:heme a synthase
MRGVFRLPSSTDLRPSDRTVRQACLAALVANVVIVVTGGAVRLTGSGLGCPTWPRCTDESLTPTPEMGVHGDIEYANRLFTYVLSAAVAGAIVASMRQRPRRPVLVRLSWALFGGIVAQAVLGGVTVLTGLHPVTVMAHFLLSMVLIAAATVLYRRSGEPAGRPLRPVVRPELRALAALLVGAVAVTVVLGTVVTGTGPHSGDKDATHRLPFAPETATQLHADFVFLMLGLAAGLLLALRATRAPAQVRRATRDLLVVSLAQGLVGYVQYFTKLPVLLVALHMLGACLVWIAALRVYLSTAEPATDPSHQPEAAAAERVTAGLR